MLKIYFKRFCILLLFYVIILQLTSCGFFGNVSEQEPHGSEIPAVPDKSGISPPKKTEVPLVLPFEPDDSLNPMFAKSRSNIMLFGLLYDSIVDIDDDFSPLPSVASSFEQDGKVWRLTVSEDLFFSDGSSITADDVVYTLKAVIANKNCIYHSRLSNVESVVNRDGIIVITLRREDDYFVSELEIPVMKRGSAEKSTDIPISCGRYVYDHSEEKHTLIAKDGERTICLYPLSYGESEYSAFVSGDINVFVSSYTDILKMKQTLDINRYSFNSDLLLFLGVSGKLENAALRKALYHTLFSIDDYVVPDLYEKYSSSGIFNENWYGIDSSSETPVFFDAGELFASAGYSLNQQTGFLEDGFGVPLSLTLLYNRDSDLSISTANTLKNFFGDAGIDLVLSSKSYTEYHKALAENTFDLYLAGCDIGASMNIEQLLIASQNYSGGLLELYYQFRAGNIGYAEFYAAFGEYCPFLPLFYPAADMITASYIIAGSVFAPQYFYDNIESWEALR